jgi:hypothetical protein
MSKRQREREIAEQADAARDQGRDHHKANVEALLVEAHRTANARFTQRHEVEAFVEGFQQARQQRDEFIREGRNA